MEQYKLQKTYHTLFKCKCLKDEKAKLIVRYGRKTTEPD